MTEVTLKNYFINKLHLHTPNLPSQKVHLGKLMISLTISVRSSLRKGSPPEISMHETPLLESMAFLISSRDSSFFVFFPSFQMEHILHFELHCSVIIKSRKEVILRLSPLTFQET